jgi:choline dehydrogenase-like flavoprotein
MLTYSDTVLVVEYGYLDDNPAIAATGGDRNSAVAFPPPSLNYNITTLPIEGLAGTQVNVMAAAVVGGSSAVNGFAFDRGSAEDYQSWIWQSGIYDQYGDEWGWDNMLHFFKRSATFHPPSAVLTSELGITWNADVWGSSTPLHAAFSPFQWKQQKIIFDALKKMPGVDAPTEGADGNATGVFWFPSTISPMDQKRSYARTAHYEGIAARRKNYHLLPGWKVTQITFDWSASEEEWTANGVLMTPREGAMPSTGPLKVRAKREVILSAGTFHTPQVLQRSGIGPRDVIEAANGTVRVELPGVGWNLQDHMYFPMNYTCTYTTSPRSTFSNLNV